MFAKYLITGTKILLLLTIVLALGVSYVGRDKALSTLFGPIDTQAISFPSLVLGPNPNQFLMCPVDFCGAPPHSVSPVFPVSVEALKKRWMEMLLSQPRIEFGLSNDPDMQYEHIQRTKLMRFPDSITVKFITVSQDQSTLAIYSRSHYGKSDFGVNETRIRSWLELIKQP